ncbi:MAG: CDGSH iron-sulfur domain-containing protein [Gammaproteobacteria bacterium]
MDDTLTTTAPADDTAADKSAIEVTVEAGKTYWWCACGLSKTQPFCDGSHKTTKLTPLKYKATETGPKLFCVCKRTQTPPFSDLSPTCCGP